MDPGSTNALLALRNNSRVLRHRRAFADCFGANPVASALGKPHQARPRQGCANIPWRSVIDPTNRNFLLGWKPELSIWLRHLLCPDSSGHSSGCADLPLLHPPQAPEPIPTGPAAIRAQSKHAHRHVEDVRCMRGTGIVPATARAEGLFKLGLVLFF